MNRATRQIGSISVRAGSWFGRYRSHRKGKSKEVSLTLGRIGEMSREQAKERLKGLIDADFGKLPIVRQVGRTGMMSLNSVGFEGRASGLPGTRGAVAELMVCADLLSKGVEVFRAVSPQATCDLAVIDKSGRFLRVEVKGVTPNSRGLIACNVKRNMGNFDMIAFVFQDGKIVYRRPEELHTELYPLGVHGTDSADLLRTEDK